MKRALSILMAVIMIITVFSLVSCKKSAPAETATGTPEPTPAETNSQSPEPASKSEIYKIGDLLEVEIVTAPDGTKTYNDKTEADLDAAKPRELVAEKLAAGREVLFAYCLNEFSADDVTRRVNGLCSAIEALGFITGTSDASQDANVEIGQIENFVTMGAAYIQCVVGSIASFEDVAKKAMDSGTYIGFWGQVPKFEAAGVYAFDQKDLGNKCGQMASEWIDLVYPDAGEGEVHCALLGNERNDDVTLRTNSIREGIEANKKAKITFYVIERLSIDAAYTAAEEAMTTDPDIRVFLTFAPGQAIGANNYIIAQPQFDLTKFGVFSCTEDATLVDLINEAKSDGNSVARGTVGYECENLWDAEFKLITDLLFFDAKPMHFVYDTLRLVKGF
ncbi:MAG: substrate-binding domain-containing protein [Oscillospiraceae bacterium]|jgi:ABC-type sugar transport system substrate-binding protein